MVVSAGFSQVAGFFLVYLTGLSFSPLYGAKCGDGIGDDIARSPAVFQIRPSRPFPAFGFEVVAALRTIDGPMWAVVARKAGELAIGQWVACEAGELSTGRWEAREAGELPRWAMGCSCSRWNSSTEKSRARRPHLTPPTTHLMRRRLT